MQVSVYLLPDTVEVLKQFGTLSAVTDKILAACESGDIDIFDKPSVNRCYCKRYNIEITNIYYITLLDRFSGKSARISLSRLLNWFAENELYSALNWQPVTTCNKQTNSLLNRIQSICAELQQMAHKLNDKELTQLTKQLIEWGINYAARNK